ncbi:MAG: hypothetical protein GY851_28030, partial [bacterium]|nr:hypothetical protein [bacterium]
MTHSRRSVFVLLIMLAALLGANAWLSRGAEAATDGDASLDVADARAGRKGMKRERYREMQRRREEFLKQNPKADANGDGILTPKEMRAYRKGPAPDFADVRYGEHERNVLDVWKAMSDEPTPLVIYIHGGGFIAGDK